MRFYRSDRIVLVFHEARDIEDVFVVRRLPLEREVPDEVFKKVCQIRVGIGSKVIYLIHHPRCSPFLVRGRRSRTLLRL